MANQYSPAGKLIPPWASLMKPTKQEHLNNVKEQIQFNFEKTLIVGSIEVDSAQEFEFEPGVSINLLKPDIKKLSSKSFDTGSQNLCDRNLRILAQKIVDSNFNNTPKICHPSKVIVYDRGAKKEHSHVYSDSTIVLLLQLPTTCQGGVLAFGHRQPTKHFKPNTINYALFDRDLGCEVTTVTKGKRIHFIFEVFDYPEEEFWTHVTLTPASVGEMTIKNVLFTHPDDDLLKKVLTTSKLKFEMVYYRSKQARKVFSNIIDIADLNLYERNPYEKPTFRHLLDNEDAKKYKVQTLVDIGEPALLEDLYFYFNEEDEGDIKGILKYYKGYLVNPEPDTDTDMDTDIEVDTDLEDSEEERDDTDDDTDDGTDEDTDDGTDDGTDDNTDDGTDDDIDEDEEEMG